jgi:hypothetical protein
MHRVVLHLAVAILGLAVVAGCDAAIPRTPLPDLLVGAARIKTWDRDPGTAVPVACGGARAADPVIGSLDGSASSQPFSTWLVADGRKVFVVWPRGFSARFEPLLELIDRNNLVIAAYGDAIDLNIPSSSTGGTELDPYEAWWVNSRCYPPVH